MCTVAQALRCSVWVSDSIWSGTGLRYTDVSMASDCPAQGDFVSGFVCCHVTAVLISYCAVVVKT
jgi:hypothetical protein